MSRPEGQAAKPIIPPHEVRLLHREIVSRMVQAGMSPADADVAARPVLRSKLANDARVSVHVRDNGQCLMCGKKGEEYDPLLPILAGAMRGVVWVHGKRCHVVYRHSIRDKVSEIISASLDRPGEPVSAAQPADRGAGGEQGLLI